MQPSSSLMEHQGGVNLSRHLVVVGDDAADEVRLRGVQGRHEVVQLRLVEGGDCLATALTLLPLLALVVVGSSTLGLGSNLYDICKFFGYLDTPPYTLPHLVTD